MAENSPIMFEGVGTLLVDPDAFFAERGGETSLAEPFLVVLGVVALSVTGGVVVVLEAMSSVSGDLQVFFVVGGLIGVAVAAVSPFVEWLLYAGAFQVLTYFFDGEGEFRDTFALTGWGFVPRLLAVFANAVAMVYLTRTLDPPADLADFAAYQSQVSGHPLSLAASALGLLVTLWSAYVWVAAVRHARAVTRRQALVSVAVPVALGLLVGAAALALNATGSAGV